MWNALWMLENQSIILKSILVLKIPYVFLNENQNGQVNKRRLFLKSL